MKYLTKILFLLLLVFACSGNSTEPKKEDNKYWSEPTDEAIILYFREFCSARLDSMVAGEIQYRLDIAKRVVPDTTITVLKRWEFGKLRVGVTAKLYNAFDTVSTFRFGFTPLDSLLTLYELKNGYKDKDNFKALTLIFPEYYNMVFLSKIFRRVDGIVWAEQNVCVYPPLFTEDINLVICDDMYEFTFKGSPRHTWIVEVVNDSATIIKEW